MNRLPSVAIATLILIAPGLAQLANLDLVVLKPWRMYGTVGQWAPYGNFMIHVDSQLIASIPISEALALQHIRELQPYPGSGDIVRRFTGHHDIRELAQKLCNELEHGQLLSFEGRVAGRSRWIPISLDHAKLCA